MIRKVLKRHTFLQKDAGILVTDLPQQAQILEEAYEKISKLKDIEGKIIIPGFFWCF